MVQSKSIAAPLISVWCDIPCSLMSKVKCGLDFELNKERHPVWCSPWVTCWCHDMERLSALLALCGGNLPIFGGFTFQRASNVELWHCLCCQPEQAMEFWCFLCCWPEQAVEQIVTLPVVWDAAMSIRHLCNVWRINKGKSLDSFINWIIRSGQGRNHYAKLNISYASLFVSIIHPWCHPWLLLLTQY